MTEKQGHVRGLYNEFCARECNENDPYDLLRRTLAVKEMEDTMEADFMNTEDFHTKVENYIHTEMTDGGTLRKERTRKKWSQQQLADFLGTSKGNISKMENSERKLTRKAAGFITEERSNRVELS